MPQHQVNISVSKSSKQPKSSDKQPSNLLPSALRDVPENFIESQTDDTLPDRVNQVLPLKQLSHYQRSIEVQRVGSDSLTATTVDSYKLTSFW